MSNYSSFSPQANSNMQVRSVTGVNLPTEALRNTEHADLQTCTQHNAPEEDATSSTSSRKGVDGGSYYTDMDRPQSTHNDTTQATDKIQELTLAVAQRDTEIKKLNNEAVHKESEVMYLKRMLFSKPSTPITHSRRRASNSSVSSSKMRLSQDSREATATCAQELLEDITSQLIEKTGRVPSSIDATSTNHFSINSVTEDQDDLFTESSIQLKLNKSKAAILLNMLQGVAADEIDNSSQIAIYSSSSKVMKDNSRHVADRPVSASHNDSLEENIRLKVNYNEISSKYNKLLEKTETLQRAFRQSQHTIALLQRYYEEEKQNNAVYEEGFMFKIWSYMALGVLIHVFLAKGLNKLF